MAKWGGVDSSGLKKLEAQIQVLNEQKRQEIAKACLKEMAARLLAKVIKRTPVGKYHGAIKRYKRDNAKKGVKKGDALKSKSGKPRYNAHPSGKKGGTLRRGWTAATHEEAENGTGDPDVTGFLSSVNVQKQGDDYVIEIINPVHYASYVENGHRTASGKGWVPGQFMMRISKNQLEREAPAILEEKLEKMIAEAMA